MARPRAARAPGCHRPAAQSGANVLEESLRKAYEVMRSTASHSVVPWTASMRSTAMGTDSGVVPHGHNLDELALMVELGE